MPGLGSCRDAIPTMLSYLVAPDTDAVAHADNRKYSGYAMVVNENRWLFVFTWSSSCARSCSFSLPYSPTCTVSMVMAQSTAHYPRHNSSRCCTQGSLSHFSSMCGCLMAHPAYIPRTFITCVPTSRGCCCTLKQHGRIPKPVQLSGAPVG